MYEFVWLWNNMWLLIFNQKKKTQCKLIQSNKMNKLNWDWDSSDVKITYTTAVFVSVFFSVMCAHSYAYTQYVNICVSLFKSLMKLRTSDWWKFTHTIHCFIHMYYIKEKYNMDFNKSRDMIKNHTQTIGNKHFDYYENLSYRIWICKHIHTL